MNNNKNQKRNESGSRIFFYPRITEFDDGPNEKPIVAGDGMKNEM